MGIYYENYQGEKVNFEQFPIVIQDKEKLFTNKWKYNSRTSIKNGGKITKWYKEILELPITLSIFADSEEEYRTVMDKLLKVTEADIYKNQQGKLWVGDYYIHCNVYESEYNEYDELFYSVDKRITIVAEYPFWIKESTYLLRKETSILQNETYLDHPMDFPFDFGYSVLSRVLNNDEAAPINFEATIYGACTDPMFTIGDNIYRVFTQLDTGEYLKINTVKEKVYKVKANGEVVNQFHLRDRDYRIYEKIPVGKSNVTWTGLNGMDITTFAERSEPRWI